jgi:hypothetical protein
MRYKYTGIFDSKTNEMLLESRSYFKYRGYSDNTMNNYCSEINEGEYYVISAGNIFFYGIQKILRFFRSKVR